MMDLSEIDTWNALHVWYKMNLLFMSYAVTNLFLPLNA